MRIHTAPTQPGAQRHLPDVKTLKGPIWVTHTAKGMEVSPTTSQPLASLPRSKSLTLHTRTHRQKTHTFQYCEKFNPDSKCYTHQFNPFPFFPKDKISRILRRERYKSLCLISSHVCRLVEAGDNTKKPWKGRLRRAHIEIVDTRYGLKCSPKQRQAWHLPSTKEKRIRVYRKTK